jgi:glycosyltransferase involved in cell wall biosynthesis
MNLDVLFVSPVGNKAFTFESLGLPGFGGVEMQTIRLAEALAKEGLKVAIAEQLLKDTSLSPNGVYYIPINGQDWLNIKIKNVVCIRSRGIWDIFPNSKKFIWFHDEADKKENNVSTWVEGMIKHNVLGICVSDWHRDNILEHAPDIPLKRIYPMVGEEFFAKAMGYNKNQLVWNASPHKGLKEAIEIFEKLRAIESEMSLIVLNPGYYLEAIPSSNVEYWQSCDQDVMRDIVSQSLCLFYPTQFKETFGMIAAEANAMGVPVASYKIAALAESSVGPFFENERELVHRILGWREYGRPQMEGQERFREKNIIPQWMELFQ